MKTRIFSIILLFAFVVCGYAQTQQGIVKTKGRLGPNGSVIAGSPLQSAMVTIKGRNRVISDSHGRFSFPVSGQSYYLVNVEKQGYLLTDLDILSKQHFYSKNSPLYIVMETPEVQMADKLAAERKIRRTLQNTLRQREEEIERLKEENKISQQEYQRKLQELYSSQKKNERLVSEMAERYSKVDYDQLDDFNRRISELILNGELAKADSLLNTKGDINARVALLKHHQEINAKEEEELSRRQENLSKSKAYTQKELEDLAVSYNEIGSACLSKGEYVEALDYLNKSLEAYLTITGGSHPDMNRILNLIYVTYIKCFAEIKDCEEVSYKSFLSNIAFTAIPIEEDVLVSQQGMNGEYYLLEFEDWNQNDIKCSLYDKNKELQGRPITILVMKDGVISQYHFESAIGFQFSLKYVGKEEKERITEAYNKWKEQNS